MIEVLMSCATPRLDRDGELLGGAARPEPQPRPVRDLSADPARVLSLGAGSVAKFAI